jgi:uncharacterized protein
VELDRDVHSRIFPGVEAFPSGHLAQGVALQADTVFWRRLDQPGHEAARLVHHAPFWQLGGTAVFAHDRRPCRLEYHVVCDAGWRTLHAKIAGWIGTQQVKAELYTDTARRWIINGRQSPAVAGCVDLDLAFSPSTNTIPIRRLALNQGERAEVRAAWLSFPGLVLEPLVQTYVRTGESSYHYESFGGDFATDLEVSAAGFVLRYPPLWESEAGG